MTKQTEALKLALEALEKKADSFGVGLELLNIAAMAAINEALAQPVQQEPVALAQEVIGCFCAAEVEGLTAALANTTDEHLKDLVERRLMHALYAAQEVERNPK